MDPEQGNSLIPEVDDDADDVCDIDTRKLLQRNEIIEAFCFLL